MRTFGRIVGKLIWHGFGLALYGLWILTMYDWLGVVGVVLAVVAYPAAYLFPFIYWIVEGFPWLYLLFWGCSMVGVIIACVCREPGESREEWLDRQ